MASAASVNRLHQHGTRQRMRSFRQLPERPHGLGKRIADNPARIGGEPLSQCSFFLPLVFSPHSFSRPPSSPPLPFASSPRCVSTPLFSSYLHLSFSFPPLVCPPPFAFPLPFFALLPASPRLCVAPPSSKLPRCCFECARGPSDIALLTRWERMAWAAFDSDVPKSWDRHTRTLATRQRCTE